MADGTGEGLSERKVDVIEVVLVLLVAWLASSTYIRGSSP